MLARIRLTGRALYHLMRLETGLQPLPASKTLLWVSLSLYGLSEFALASLGHRMSVSLLGGLAAVLLLGALTTVALSLAGFSSRVMQTISALAAGGAVIVCGRALLQVLLQTAVPGVDLGGFLLFPLFVWHLLICAHVYREALARGSYQSRGLAIAYVLCLIVLRKSLDVWA